MLLFLILFCCINIVLINAKVEELRELLFPLEERRKAQRNGSQRSLKGIYNGTVPCVTCEGLNFCSSLNGLLIEEIYSPTDLILKDTCVAIEARGARFAAELFGSGHVFRDTEQCRSIVLQYLCLFWYNCIPFNAGSWCNDALHRGSNNEMYTNFCIYQEVTYLIYGRKTFPLSSELIYILQDVSDPNPANHKLAPRPPCRSFCVQVRSSLCFCPPDSPFCQCFTECTVGV